ncbi:MAG: ATP-dependent zinc metalloprotease FtsH [Kiritimatiellae bacterium]|nr:ATP-dependent zinc metalloprotease FtsH [Kiritimatiellia bacterium]
MYPRSRKPQDDDRKTKTEPSRMPIRGMVVWLLLLALFLILYHFFADGSGSYKEIPFNPDFVTLVKEGRVQECEVIEEMSGGKIQGTAEPVVGSTAKPMRFRVYYQGQESVQELLLKYGAPIDGLQVRYRPQNPLLLHFISGAVPFLLVLGLLYFLFIRQIRSVGHGALSFGKSRARMLARDKNRITFQDVAGIDEAKEDVQEIIEFLKDPKRFQKLGGRIPKGVLMMGPPGTGKTLLAKAIAGEADVPFFTISGSDFVEMFVGVGASRVRDMFEQGKKHAPCIIFIDEIDAVGRSRFSGIGGGHDEREQTLNALLVEMDGFDTQEGVIIIAATNRPDVLDPALLRPGRFDRQIVIDMPDLNGRESILKLHAKNIKLAADVDLRRIARGTPGLSGADLASLINEAALLAAREGKQAVLQQDLEEARDKVRWGRERRSRVLDEKERRITAYHEAGHALVLQIVPDTEPLHKITIIPRGTAFLGATMQLPEKDRYTEGRTKVLSTITGLMGGRVAEELTFDDITSGAASDLKEATRIARLMVCQWGMSKGLGPQTFGVHEELLFLGREVTRQQDFSEDTARRIDAEVNELLRECYQRAKDIVVRNREKLDMIADRLLERETLEGRDVEEIVRYGRILSEEEREEREEQTDPEEEAPRQESRPKATGTRAE